MYTGDSLGRGIMADSLYTVSPVRPTLCSYFSMASLRNVAFSPTGRVFAASASSFAASDSDGPSLVVWDTAKSRVLWSSQLRAGPLQLSMDRPAALAVSDSVVALTALQNNDQILICDTRSGKVLLTLPAPASIAALHLSPDTHTLAAVTVTGTVTWWHLPDGARLL